MTHINSDKTRRGRGVGILKRSLSGYRPCRDEIFFLY